MTKAGMGEGIEEGWRETLIEALTWIEGVGDKAGVKGYLEASKEAWMDAGRYI